MSKKENVSNEVNTSKEKNRKKAILVIVGVILLAIILFLLWFFNRKFDVVFDLNNGTEKITVQVKYNHIVDNKDIKTKEDLGEKFVDWYEIIEVKDNEEILTEKPFDFETKIKRNTKLKATYESAVETITITFDSRGGSSVDAIVINKGAALTLPANPTYAGYKFTGWEDLTGTIIDNKKEMYENTILYAKWEKIEEEKPIQKPQPTKPTESEQPKEEKISLSLSNKLLHRNGVNTSKATATTENVNGNVVYSVNNSCVSINSSTGDITANNSGESCKNGGIVTVTATTPGGKTASATLTLEQDLILSVTSGNESKTITSNGWFTASTATFEIIPNIDVTWTAKCVYYSDCKYTGSTATLKRAFRGGFEQEIRSTGEIKKDAVLVTAKTAAGQHMDYKISKLAN